MRAAFQAWEMAEAMSNVNIQSMHNQEEREIRLESNRQSQMLSHMH
jgi:hypothetical protein